MKTTFSRLFSLFAALIFLCLLLLGLVFRAMFRDYLREDARQSLHSNAVTLVDLATAYEATGEGHARWGDFHIAMTSSARMAGTDVLFCDVDGQVLLCSCGEFDCRHSGQTMETALMQEILAEDEYFGEGNLAGLYETPQFLVGMSVPAQLTEQTVGVLILVASQAEISGLLTQATILLIYVAILGLAVALVASYLLSRRQTLSIRNVADAANRFGRGELDARVTVGGRNSVEEDELAVAFNAMAESLAQSEKKRQEFVANVSHELKTPMTTISGFVDGMLDGTIPTQKHPQYMQLVSDEVRRLSRLVRSMLEVSRLQSQEVAEEKKKRFDLCESIGQVLISFERRVVAKDIYMDVELPDRSVWTKADPDGITQVLYNLVDNAVKFCDRKGRLLIRLTVEGSKAKVTVQNTGETVPPEELPLLFDRFHKADKSRSADREGVGLGLYIVKTVLNSHGEDISVTSQNGVTTFIFTLPVVR